MNTESLPRTETIKEWLNGRVTVPYIHTLNRKMKRLVAIASLFGYVFDEQKRNKKVEERLSKIMNLSDHSNSLTLPMIYHGIIWGPIEKRNKNELLKLKDTVNVRIKQGINSEDAQTCANLLISILPAYLIYDTIDNVRQDVEHLFESLPFILEQTNHA